MWAHDNRHKSTCGALLSACRTASESRAVVRCVGGLISAAVVLFLEVVVCAVDDESSAGEEAECAHHAHSQSELPSRVFGVAATRRHRDIEGQIEWLKAGEEAGESQC